MTLSGTVTIGEDTVAAGDIECAAVPEGGLGPGGTVSCTGTYAVDQGDVDAGAVTNRATATLNGVTSAESKATVSWERRSTQDNNDPPENGNPPPVSPDDPTLSVSAATVGEDGGSVTVTVSLAPTTVQTVRVTYSTGDVTATAGKDYTGTSGRLTFTPGLGSQGIAVALSDDAVDEPDETFTVGLSGVVNAVIGTGTATVTITGRRHARAGGGAGSGDGGRRRHVDVPGGAGDRADGRGDGDDGDGPGGHGRGGGAGESDVHDERLESGAAGHGDRRG